MPIGPAIVISMSDNPADAVETMRGKLEGSEYEISDADREVLLEMSNTIRLLGPSQYSDHRHEFLLMRNLALAKEVGGLADALDDRDAAEDLVAHINTAKNGSPETNKDYRVAFRTFGNIVTDGDDPPDSLEWIPGGYPSTYDPAPEPEKMYRWEEHILPMLDACHNSRDRAIIALAWDLGPRPSELFDLTIDRISDHEYGMQVTLYGGKRGTRSPILVPSVPYVRQWLQDHPADRYDEAPFCSGLHSADGVANNRVRDILKEVVDRAVEAGTMRPPSTPTPSRFRKSSASYLASQGVSQAHLEDHHGWTRGSTVAARYIAVFDDANEREIAKAHGLDVQEDEPDGIGPVVCPRCQQKTPREKDACVWCDQVLSQSAAEKVEEQRQTAVSDMTSVEAEVREALATVDSELGDDVTVRLDLVPDE